MKYCNICGAKIPDDAPYCEACGAVCENTQVTGQQTPPAAQPQYPPPQGDPYAPPWQQQYQSQPAQDYNAQEMPVNNKYTAIGGWLLFFIIMSCITALLNLITAVSGIATNTGAETQEALLWLGSEWRTAINMEIVAYFVLIGVAALQIYAIVQVFSRSHSFLKFFQLTYFGIMAYYVILLIAYAVIGFEYLDGEPATTIGSITGSVIGLFIYTTYYCRSERVKTFMGGDDYKRNAIFSLK